MRDSHCQALTTTWGLTRDGIPPLKGRSGMSMHRLSRRVPDT